MKDKGTIIYIGGFELPDKNAAAQRVMANAQIIRSIGYSPVLVGISKVGGNFNYNQAILNEYHNFDCWSLRYPVRTIDWFEYLSNIDNFIKIISKYKDVRAVICYNYQALAFEKIRIYCKKNDIKIISDCTEWYRSDEGNLMFRVIKYLDTSFRMRYINRKVDALIVATTYLKDYYFNKTAVVIPTLISTVVSNDQKELDLVTGDFPRLVYAGVPFRLGKRLKKRDSAKDRLDILIRALYNISKKGVNFIFDIYGITKEQYLISIPEDEQLINELIDKVNFHGRKDSEYIKNELMRADFTLLIRDDNRTTKAGFPTKFTESIICGTPVISNKTSDLDKFIIEGKNGFLLNRGSNWIDEDKLIKILTLNKSTRIELKEYCKKSNVFNIFNWSEEMRKIIES